MKKVLCVLKESILMLDMFLNVQIILGINDLVTLETAHRRLEGYSFIEIFT